MTRDFAVCLKVCFLKVTNEVFEHLGRPLFLTCPVEYSKNRAFPNLKESEYLNTVGAGMDPEIGIFWTGNKVVSETITKEDVSLSSLLYHGLLLCQLVHFPR